MPSPLTDILRPQQGRDPPNSAETLTDKLNLQTKVFKDRFYSIYGYQSGNLHHERIALKGWYAPISPTSPFAQCWELVCGVFLLYSIFVTPLLLSFFTVDAGFCGPAPTGCKYRFAKAETIALNCGFSDAVIMDMIVDSFFLLDLPLKFFIGVIDRGNVITAIADVSRFYFKNTFFLDCLASIPVGWIEFFAVPDFDCETAEHSNSAFKYLRIIRLVRMIRIFKVKSLSFDLSKK
jgi:hypothetical protein